MYKRALFFLMLTITFGLPLKAQKEKSVEKNSVELIYKYYGDSTVLRWGYSNPVDWFQLKEKRVEIWRRNVSKSGKYEKIGEVIPWDSTSIELKASKMNNPDMMVVVLENLHRNWGNTYFTDYSTILEKSDNLYNRWSLVHLAADLDVDAAIAAGLRFVDKNIEKNTTYAYKIMAGKITDHTVVFPVVKNKVPVIYNISEEESRVDIFWDKKLHDYQFTAYWIETSTDGINYKKDNTQPYVQMLDENISIPHAKYTYSVQTENYKPLYIRLQGIDAFGELSQPSESVKCMGRDKTPPSPAYMVADSSVSHMTKKLSWTLPLHEDIFQCHLERSFKDRITRIENCCVKNQNYFIDSLTQEGIYKYRLITADTAGNESFSNPVYTKVYDLVPPAKPLGIRAVADTSGIILLTWDKHPEEDVTGYNVYASDKKNRNFVKLNAETLRQRFFTDSIDLYLLTKDRYYYVIAVDNDFLRSNPSDTILVKRPDIIPPSPAVIADYAVGPEGIRLTIFPSSSKDVLKHELWRKSADEEWRLQETFRAVPKGYTDKTVNAGSDYFYKVYAIDSSGLKSHNVKEIKLTAFPETGEKPELSYSKNEESIDIFIQSIAKDSVEFMMYKAENGGKITLYKILRDNKIQEKLKPGNQYVYRVRERKKSGVTGPFSDKLNIQM
jgi:fibronectin type 3 domain-containing protein